MKAPTALILFKIHRLQPVTSVVKENLFKWKSPNYTPSIPPFPVLAVMRDQRGFKGFDFGKSWVVSTGSWASQNWTGSITGNKSRGFFGCCSFFFFSSKREFSKFLCDCWSFGWVSEDLLVWAAGLGCTGGCWTGQCWGWGQDKDMCVQTTKTSRKNEDRLRIFIRRSAQPWLCASHGPADNVPSHCYTFAKRRRGKNKSQTLSPWPCPCQPCPVGTGEVTGWLGWRWHRAAIAASHQQGTEMMQILGGRNVYLHAGNCVE